MYSIFAFALFAILTSNFVTVTQAQMDNCSGVCDTCCGHGDPNVNCNDLIDCSGTCGGTATLDECGNCGRPEGQG